MNPYRNFEMPMKPFRALLVCALVAMSGGCAHVLKGERVSSMSEPTDSLLVVLERKNFSIISRPEGGFYENGIASHQAKLELALKETLVDHLQKSGVTADFMAIPAVLGGINEERLSWNTATSKDKFPYLLVVSPQDGMLSCRPGGFQCSARFRLELKVIRRTGGSVVWEGGIKDVGPEMLASTSSSPSALIAQIAEKLSEDGVLKKAVRN